MHIFLGCCYHDGYAVALGPYINSPVTMSRITLLKSSPDDGYYNAIPFETVHFPFVFTPGPYSDGACLADECGDLTHEARPESEAPPEIAEPTSYNTNHLATEETDAVAKWQAAAGGRIQRRPAARASNNSQSPPKGNQLHPSARQLTWGPNKRDILLNINNERVDAKPEEADYEVKESMLDRTGERKFCHFYHLLGTCLNASSGKTCRYTHGPELSPAELVVLRSFVRKIPCEIGSKCRRIDCFYGHVCSNQPGCLKERCHLRKFHEIDPTAVQVWRPC